MQEMEETGDGESGEDGVEGSKVRKVTADWLRTMMTSNESVDEEEQ